MKYFCLPYFENDGAWTFSDTFIKSLWQKMKAKNLDKTVFYRGDVRNENEFLQRLKAPGTFATIVANEEKECVAVAWLNCFSDQSAWGHFCFFPPVWGEDSAMVGRQILQHWFSNSNLSVIQGRVAANNTRAIVFIRAIGMTFLGTIPDAIYDVYERENTGAVIAYIHKSDIGDQNG